jgi:hypothetical protein
MKGTYLLVMRDPVYRRHESYPGFRTELENRVGDAKGLCQAWASNNFERQLDERRFVKSLAERGLKSVKTKTGAFGQDICLTGSQDQLLLRPVLK